MATRINERFFGFFGFAGFVGFIPGYSVYYVFFLTFFFFAFARPTRKDGMVLSDERWASNVTKACRNAFFVLLLPLMLIVGFLRSTGYFALAVELVPVAALLSFAGFFVYYDRRGE
jgi:TRAP-type C4-dicarboxylate transport system permease large subunit